MGYKQFDFINYAYKLGDVGDYETIYGQKVSKVHSWTKWDAEKGKIFESDVSSETRILVDLYYESDDISTGHRILFFDIEVETEFSLPDIRKAENKITAISIYDQISDDYFVYVLDDENTIQQYRRENEEIISFANEEDLLLAFLQKWEEIHPTIITGWNIDNFDVPYLYHRLLKVLGENYARKLSPIGIIFYNENRRRYFIAGVSCLDYLPLYRNYAYKERSSYSLDFISRLELGEGKVKYDGNFGKLRKDDINKFIEYSLVDTKLVVKLDQKLNFIDLVQGICHKGHVPYEDIFYSSRWIEGAILTYMKHHKLVAPNKNPENRKLMSDTDVRFSGAYVKSPETAKYEWIYDLDFTSLYPSIVLTLNISPETKVGKVENWDSSVHLKDKSVSYTANMLGKDYQFTGDELQETLEKYGFCISSNGVVYRKDKIGIIPKILEEWNKDKNIYDSLMKEYGNKGDKEKSRYYKRRRTIAKVMLNSVYGVLGLPSFRFYDLANAEAVTTTGVSLIKYTELMTNHYYNKIMESHKDYVIYMDTDSIFCPAKPLIEKIYPEVDTNDDVQMTEHISKITIQVQDFLNNSFKLFGKNFLNVDSHRFDVKREIIAKSGIWITKKRYALWVIYDKGVITDEIDYKGLDVVRSNFPNAFKNFLTILLSDMLKNIDRDIIDKKVLDFKEMIKNVKIEEIAVPTSVKNVSKFETYKKTNNKTFGNWIKATPAHVKAAVSHNELLDYYKLRNKFSPIKSGEKIRWMYLKENEFGMDGLAIRGYDDPIEVLEFARKYIDREKIFERILKSKIEDCYKAVNWEMPTFQRSAINKYFDF